MNIVVPVKLVPDLAEELEINSDGTDLDRDTLSFRINEFCDHALEEALQLKQAHGGKVTVLALDRDETEKVLFTALAKGADRAIKVTGVEDGAPTRAAAKAFCKALEGIEYDVVMTGVQAADDRDGQLAVLMASMLGIPHVSVVSAVEQKGGKLLISKEYAGGVIGRFEATGKVVLGVQAARTPPRYAAVSRVQQIKKEAKIEEVEVAGIGNDCGSTVRRMFMPEKGEGAKMLTGDTDAVADQIVTLIKGKKG